MLMVRRPCGTTNSRQTMMLMPNSSGASKNPVCLSFTHPISPIRANAKALRFLSSLADGAFFDRNSPNDSDWVVELVGLKPTTRVLWNAGVSDQLTWSDTRHRQQPHHGEVVGGCLNRSGRPIE